MSPGIPRSNQQNRRATLTLSGVIACLAIGASFATGASGKNGGVTAPSAPTVKDVRCIERCLDVRKVAETGTAQLSGRDLGAVRAVRLSSGDGKIQVKPTRAGAKLVEFKVPKGAESGKPLVIDDYGNSVRSPVAIKVKPEGAISDVEGFSVRKADATPSKSFYDGKKPSRVEYLFEAEGPTDIRIDVLKGKRDRLVDSIVEKNQKPFTTQRATWDGLADNGKVAPSGKYKFEVSQVSGGQSGRTGFRYYSHKFPVSGRHQYGDGLGAGRGHQGQDIFSTCGSPIYAARGGKVQVKATQSAAGNYVVIDGRKTGVDYVYMHMERGGRPKQGSKVRTGEVIGYESDTGRATGCHLHFEIWSAPGWYEGGNPLNPTKLLKKWDRWS